MTNEEINKKCCEILGIHWHEAKCIWNTEFEYPTCTCGKTFRWYSELRAHIGKSPNFLDDTGVVRLLRELKKQQWYVEFIIWMWDLRDVDTDTYDYITTPGLLAKKLVEWKEG